ncbi:nitroreductase/quinone reductase family protein [Agrococcus sp. SGAir0287]|uniref:nitroreductase/quinone reductase family protein n=1 Tax=Agrococcus sp. SGAir0287 TaxID=2070347 RepID=UPI0010CCD7C5|nr:nitroreductase/quinone reductase family protein [Agrococcus sp. SGAir0287]QCR20517.1 nitroreductase family deazaflavin-dependent oxidoreductase [Agrococcus sp. SGAir0287]
MAFNDMIIDAFRAGEGEVREPIDFGRSLGLLHIPKRDGTIALIPLMAIEQGGSWHVVASAAGSPQHPAWSYSLRRASEIDLEVAGDIGAPIRVVRVAVTELTGAERDRMWEAFTQVGEGFRGYEAKAQGRVFPIFRLTPLEQPDAA